MAAPYRRIDVSVPGGYLAFGSVSSTYVNLLSSIQGRGVVLFIASSLDTEVVVSLNGGTTDWLTIPARTNISIDLGASGAEFAGTVSVKDNGAAASSGAISAAVVRVL